MSTSIFGLTQRDVSFKKPQWNLYKLDTIGTWQKYQFTFHCLLKIYSEGPDLLKIFFRDPLKLIFTKDDNASGVLLLTVDFL